MVALITENPWLTRILSKSSSTLRLVMRCSGVGSKGRKSRSSPRVETGEFNNDCLPPVKEAGVHRSCDHRHSGVGIGLTSGRRQVVLDKYGIVRSQWISITSWWVPA